MSNSRPSFVYVIYIQSTPEKVWHALTDASASAQFWFGFHVESEWKPGSAFALKHAEGREMNTGTVLESDPPRRLVFTWHPEFDEMRHERPSRVTYDIEKVGDQVRLTVIHEDFDAGSKVFDSISRGWPMVLSSLKSFLETGRGLAPVWREQDKALVEKRLAS